jgi:rhamnulose-1-phosphate aldolase
MNLEYPPVFIRDIHQVALFLWQKGWAERNSGNISARVTGAIPEEYSGQVPHSTFSLGSAFPALANDLVYVTACGSRMRDIPDDPAHNMLLVKIGPAADSYGILFPPEADSGNLRPTSELITHLAVHEYLKNKKPGIRVVIHTHPDPLIALSHATGYKQENILNRTLWSMIPEAVIAVPDGLGVVSYHMPGSVELARATVEALQDHHIILWEKHGVLAIGETASSAFDLIDVLVKSAGIFLQCLASGFEPEGLTNTQIEELRKRDGHI